MSLPMMDLDFTPVITRRTRIVFARSSSTEQPQMIRDMGLIFWPTISSSRVGEVHFAEEGGLEGLVNRVLHAVPLCLAFADPDHRDPAALHDRHEVRVVEVHEARLRDDLRHALRSEERRV